MMDVVYLAGPYTSAKYKQKSLNRAVERLRARLLTRAAAYLTSQEDFAVISPITQGHAMVSVYGGLPTEFEFWERIDTSLLSRCDALYILTLPGWKESRGVTAERKFAEENQIPVYFLDPETYDVSPAQ